MIIGLMGQSGAGKDTVADFLVSSFGFVKVSMADPLKRICKEVYDFTDDQLWGPSERRNAVDVRYPNKDGFLTPRTALQTLGTEWGRECFPNTWVNYAIDTAKKILEQNYGYSQKRGLYRKGSIEQLFDSRAKGVVIPDVRFKNELMFIHAVREGYVVRIKRSSATGNVGIKGHASEEEQKTINDSELDYILNNDSTKVHLYQMASEMVYRLPGSSRISRALNKHVR